MVRWYTRTEERNNKEGAKKHRETIRNDRAQIMKVVYTEQLSNIRIKQRQCQSKGYTEIKERNTVSKIDKKRSSQS